MFFPHQKSPASVFVPQRFRPCVSGGLTGGLWVLTALPTPCLGPANSGENHGRLHRKPFNLLENHHFPMKTYEKLP